MKFLYSTDLHGDTRKYESLLRYATDHGIGYIHLGADILPKGNGILKLQKDFINRFLKDFYARCAERSIKIFAMFGNDDIYTRKGYFRNYGSLLDEHPETIEGYHFTGYPFVPDYPFGLVTACKYDYQGWEPEAYYGRKLEVDSKGFVDIPDRYEYFKQKGTIKGDLEGISADRDTIIAIHCPPCSLGMDVCASSKEVGSRSIYEWIAREQPRLVLCGHIHESRSLTGIWKANIGSSVVLQPGQSGPNSNSTYAVVIELGGTEDNYTDVIL